MNICRLYLVRHGESAANRDGLVSGHIDTPLTTLGEEQAEATKKVLAGVKFDAVYSSDLERAAKTAEIIADVPVPAAHQLPDLRERHFGRFEGQPADEWMEANKEYERRYASLPFAERLEHNYADSIESDKVVLARVDKALKRIAKAHPGQTVLVGLHGGPIRIMLMHLGYAPFITAGAFQNGGYVVLDGDGKTLRVEKAVGITVATNAE